MPYRTFDDRIDGLVITFFNISDLKDVEIKLHETAQINRLLLNSSPDVTIRLLKDLKIQEFNPAAEMFFGKKREDVINENYVNLFVPAGAQKKTAKYIVYLLEKLMDSKFKMPALTGAGMVPDVEWSSTILHDNRKMAAGMIIIHKQKKTDHE